MNTPRRIAVVGAGMAGMAAAYELARTPGVALTVFEASPRLGGTVETVTLPSAGGEPFVIECGPDSWVSDKRAARELAVELGLADELIASNDAQRRTYIAQFGAGIDGSGAGRRGELIPMPDGMRMMVPTRWAPMLESPLFSWQARLAYLREPKRAEELKQYALANPQDESVASFVRRHFGDEATRTIAGPLLAGVFGGEIETLSAQAVLAPFVRMEREHGSLIAAVMAREAGRQAPPEPIFTTLRSGLQTLIDRMAARLEKQSVRCNTRVTGLRRAGPGSAGSGERVGWLLGWLDSQSQAGEEHFDAVILATPAQITRELLAPVDAEAAGLLAIEASSAIVVALGYEPESAARLRIPRGFGFLVPPGEAPSEGPRLLAGTFMHEKFAHRAPPGSVFLRGFFGGRTAPQLLDWTDEAIAEAARDQFSRLLGPLPAADHTVVRRWPRSLPQYPVGHLQRMARLEELMQQIPALRLVGNSYHGVGLPNLVEHGRAAARSLVLSRNAG